jgi:hypothetical protein
MNNNKNSKPTLYLIGSPKKGIWLTKEQLVKVVRTTLSPKEVEELYERVKAKVLGD